MSHTWASQSGCRRHHFSCLDLEGVMWKALGIFTVSALLFYFQWKLNKNELNLEVAY